MGRRARDRMVVGFTITCTITAYHCQRVSSILNHITEILLKVALTVTVGNKSDSHTSNNKQDMPQQYLCLWGYIFFFISVFKAAKNEYHWQNNGFTVTLQSACKIHNFLKHYL
jgi:hypothetical protein